MYIAYTGDSSVSGLHPVGKYLPFMDDIWGSGCVVVLVLVVCLWCSFCSRGLNISYHFNFFKANTALGSQVAPGRMRSHQKMWTHCAVSALTKIGTSLTAREMVHRLLSIVFIPHNTS